MAYYVLRFLGDKKEQTQTLFNSITDLLKYLSIAKKVLYDRTKCDGASLMALIQRTIRSLYE